MWRCLNCETINEGEVCTVCGEKPPTPEQLEAIRREELAAQAAREAREAHMTPPPLRPTRTSTPTAPKPAYRSASDAPVFRDRYDEEMMGVAPVKEKKSGFKMGAVVAVAAVVIAIFVIVAMNITSSNNKQSRYDQAYSLMVDGDYEQAKDIFEELGDYRDSSSMVNECDVRRAEQYVYDGDYIEAYNLYQEMGETFKAEEVVERIYDEAVYQYGMGNYTEAEEYFGYTSGMGNTEDYLTLIDGQNGRASYYELEELIGFEDASEIIMERYYFDFLKGNWETYSDDYIRFTLEEGTQWCRYNIPNYDGGSWKIEDSIHYIGENGSWNRAWSYKIVNEDTINVYNYYNSNTYYFYRQ